LNKTVVQQNPCIFKKIEHYNVLSFWIYKDFVVLLSYWRLY
jgi:hypothetical protein